MPQGYYRNRQYNLYLDAEYIQSAFAAVAEISAYCDDKSRSAKGYPDKIGTSWTGRAATAIKTEMLGWATVMERSHLRLGGAAAALQKYKNDIYDINHDLESLNRDYEDLKSAHSSASIQSNDAYSRLSRESPEEKWASDQKACDHRFSVLLERAETAARALANSLTEAVLVPIPNELHAQQCLSPSSEQKLSDITYSSLLTALPLVGARAAAGYGDELSAIEAEAKAQAWATRLEAVSVDINEKISAEELAAFATLSKDPQFAAALIRKLGVNKYVELTQKIARQSHIYQGLNEEGIPVEHQ
ncbi:MAG: hypothetical protein ACRC0L_04805, partial [Angustibacter sp.]